MSNPKLSALIQDEIIKQGAIPFARFMDLCLYHPEFGYYQSPENKIGPKGDYYTSPSLHPIFAKLIAKQIFQMLLALQSDNDKMMLFEFGAGEGTLCQGILDFLQKEAPDIFSRLTYVIIEKSLSFQARQKNRLLPHYANTVLWKDQMPKDQVGIVLSNEFLDALPVHRMRFENQSLNEVYVNWKEGHFHEQFDAPSSPALLSYFEPIKIEHEGTFDCEMNLAAKDWMRDVAQTLKKGFVLTIDYGYPADQLYHPSRPRGTFLCYYKHTVNENPYAHIGEQDMTSHIDFTSLAHVGQALGLSLLGFTDQTHFLMGLGIAQEMQVHADKMETSLEDQKIFLAMKQLMAPDRMGKTFKVLIQGKGMTSPCALDGLTFRAFPKDCLSSFSN